MRSLCFVDLSDAHLVVDATVVTMALTCGAIVFTSEPEDIAQLSAASEVKPGLVVRRV